MNSSCPGEVEPAVVGKLHGFPAKPLEELARERVKPGGFDTVGFVTRHFVPVPCPPKATCKPQPPRHLILGDAASNAKHEIFLETPNPKAFPIGTKLEVSVVVCNTQSYGVVINEGRLLAARPSS